MNSRGEFERAGGQHEMKPSVMLHVRRRIHEIVEVATPGDRASRAFDIFILSLIALNIAAMILATVESVYQKSPALFRVFEIVSVAIFSVEYLLRLWSCTAAGSGAHPLLGRLRFALSFMGLTDLLAVLPFYLPFLGLDLRVLRAVRLLRIFRVVKLGRYSKAIQIFGRVFKAKKEELIASAFILFLLLLFSSCLLYFAERESQPETFGNMPDAMWWSATTLTTVGYGDVYPITPWGKFLAAAVSILGIGAFALPTGILAVGFVEEMQNRKKKPIVCPRCGKKFG